MAIQLLEEADYGARACAIPSEAPTIFVVAFFEVF